MNPRDFRSRLQRRAKRAGLTVPGDVAERLGVYFDLLSRWNKRMNLTALDKGDEAIDRLLIEPLVAVKYLPSRSAVVLDIGSGGGSPAIPMKLCVPGTTLRMVEAKTRKAAFLRDAVRELDLRETVVETSRYEELLARPDLHEAAEVVTVRAVRVEARMLTSLQAFLLPDGKIFLFRGSSGPDVPPSLTPPLTWDANHPLVESLRSRLTILRKVRLGHTPRAGSDTRNPSRSVMRAWEQVPGSEPPGFRKRQ